ncbi:MAG TPA: potassium channel protein [Archaeoglobaceae archaeon]|nr:potassium channel protein [Archaeoglobaceae archaeon]
MARISIEEKIIKIVTLLLSILVIGTLSYHFIEGWSLFDSLYMTVITITTTGYSEVAEMSPAGKVLSMLLMFVGVGVFFYSINLLVPVLVERGQERWKKMLEDIKDHNIVCGYGIMGREITEELPKDKVVIIDMNIEKVNLAREKGLLAIQGDATEEEVLEMANVRTAKALITCLPSDSANAFAIMIAKDLNPNIFTIAVLRTPAGSKKISRAGVDMLLSPYSDAAKKIYMALSRPAVVELIEIFSKKGGTLMLQKINLQSEHISGKTLRDMDIRKKSGCTVVAIERNGEIVVPDPDTVLSKGDILYVMGNNEQLETLVKLVS